MNDKVILSLREDNEKLRKKLAESWDDVSKLMDANKKLVDSNQLLNELIMDAQGRLDQIKHLVKVEFK